MGEFLLFLVFDIIFSIPIFVIGHKTGNAYKWLAFVPIANFWLLCDIADREPIWILALCFLPVGYLVWGYIWAGVCEMMGKPDWIGYLMMIPVLSIAVACYIAFYEEEDTGPDLLAGKN